MVERTPNIALAKPAFDQRQWQDDINDNFTVLDALWAKYFATTGLVGVWQNATAYTVGNLVVDETLGSIWRCEVAHTSASTGTFLATRTSNPTYWSNYTIGVRYKGAWSSAAVYAVGDFVVADSSKFAVANIAHTAGSAFNTSGGVWEILIDVTAAASSIAAAVSSAGTYATAAGVSASAAGTYATAAGTFATAAGTYATAAALSAAMAAAGVVWCGTGSGADDIVLAATSFTLVDGATVEWRQVSNNTTTVRLNVNSTGLTALLNSVGSAVNVAGTLVADRIYRAKYSTTSSSFEFLGPVGATAATQSQVNAGVSSGIYVSPAFTVLASWFAPRNWITNPEGYIFQRAAPTADNAYAWDRWRLLLGAANAATVSQLTSGLPTGAKNAMRLTVGSGNNNKFGIFQIFEGVDVYALHGKTVCLQAQLKATAALTDIRMAIVEWTGTEDATSGDPISAWNTMATVPTYAAGWANLNTPANLSVTTSFAQYSVTATVGSSATNLAVFIWSEDTSNTQTTDILDVTMVMLTAAGSPVNYVSRPYVLEFEMCRRYCQVISGAVDGIQGPLGAGSAATTTTGQIFIPLSPIMRATPTVSFNAAASYEVIGGGSTITLTNITTYVNRRTGLTVSITVAAGLTAGWALILEGEDVNNLMTAIAEL